MKNRSDKPTEQVGISELDALTIYCALSAEIVRRERYVNPITGKGDPLPVTPRLQELHDKFRLIADGQNCEICGGYTLEVIQVPREGSMDSGPYTIPYPCHEACKAKFVEQWELWESQ